MKSVKERITALVDKLCRDVVTALVLKYRVRLDPSTLQHFRDLFEDALGHAKHLGELHANDPPDDPDDGGLVESLEDTKPGWTRRPPPTKKP